MSHYVLIPLLVVFVVGGLNANVNNANSEVSLESVLERLTFLETKLRQNEHETRELRKITQDQKSVIALQGEKIRELENNFDKNTQPLDPLRQEVLTNRQTLVDVHTRFVAGLSHSRRREERQSGNKNNNRIAKRQAGTSLAFTVYLDQPGEYHAGQIIKYNKIITNEGFGYDVNTGVFSCPESGLYLFSFAVWERSDSNSVSGNWFHLNVNGNDVVAGVADAYHNAQDLQGGNTAILRLTEGDKVWVSAVGSYHVHGGSTKATTFSGVYLHA